MSTWRQPRSLLQEEIKGMYSNSEEWIFIFFLLMTTNPLLSPISKMKTGCFFEYPSVVRVTIVARIYLKRRDLRV